MTTAAVDAAHDVHDATKVTLTVFACLMVLTAVTVSVARLHLANRPLAIAIGLSIALIKGGLVAAFFMHLASERVIIRSVVCVSLVGLFLLVLLPWLDFMKTAGAWTQTAGAPSGGAPLEAPHGP